MQLQREREPQKINNSYMLAILVISIIIQLFNYKIMATGIGQLLHNSIATHYTADTLQVMWGRRKNTHYCVSGKNPCFIHCAYG